MIGYVTVFLCAAALVLPEVSYAGHHVYQKCAKNWIKRGCRIDDDRGLTSLFDDRKDGNIQIDWENFHSYVWDLACRCRAKAIAMKNTWFALEEYGICFSGAGSINSFLSRYHPAPPRSCVGALKHNKTIVSDIDGEICTGGIMRAYYYQITNPNAPIGSAEGNEEEGEAVAPCTKVSDVILVVDSSGSIGEENFKRVKEFLQKLVDYFDFGKGREKSRLGLVTFDDKVYMHMTWLDSEAMTKGQIRERINNLRYSAGSTSTDKALKFVVKSIIQPFKRNKVPKTVFVMTDGKCFRGRERLPAPSSQLRGLGAKVIAIGIGKDVDMQELMEMTKDRNNIFLYSTFKNLIDVATRALNKMIGKACL